MRIRLHGSYGIATASCRLLIAFHHTAQMPLLCSPSPSVASRRPRSPSSAAAAPSSTLLSHPPLPPSLGMAATTTTESGATGSLPRSPRNRRSPTRSSVPPTAPVSTLKATPSTFPSLTPWPTAIPRTSPPSAPTSPACAGTCPDAPARSLSASSSPFSELCVAPQPLPVDYSSPGGVASPLELHWTSCNQLFRRHPRLLSIESCSSLRGLKPVLAFAVASGLFRNSFVASRLLVSAASFDVPFASLVFSRIASPSVFCWNTIIRAVTDDPSAAFSLYAEMRERGTPPDDYTFPPLIKACHSSPYSNLGRSVHCHAFVLGMGTNPFLQTELVSLYLYYGCFADANHLFDEIAQKDVVSWTAMISGLVDQDCHAEALEVFDEMRLHGTNVNPNVATMVSTLSASAGLGSLANARSLHAHVKKSGFEDDILVRNSLIDTYAKCGSVACALQVFDEIISKDLHSWTSMITALASHGRGVEALQVFSRMLEVGVSPDSTTFIVVLSACSHAGLVDVGIEIFNSMEILHNVVPELKHYGCVVDLLSRTGLLGCAYEFMSRMPVAPNLATLGALLSACRVQNDAELAELVAKKIDSVCQYKGGANVLLSNMYANAEQWHEVVAIREITRTAASKPPARSWITVRGIVHEFVVGDWSHPLCMELQLVLHSLRKSMDELQ